MQNKEANKKETVDTMETVLFTDIQVNNIRRAPFRSVSQYIALIGQMNGLKVAVSTDGRYMCARPEDYNKAVRMFENAVRYN